MSGRYYGRFEVDTLVEDISNGDVLVVGSVVDLDNKKHFSSLLKQLKLIEDKGGVIQSYNEPSLSGKTYSILCDSLAVLQFYRDIKE